MTVDLTKEYSEDGFLRWFMICTLAGVEVTETVRAEPRIVTMQINGAEVNPLTAITRLEEEFNRIVSEKAEALVGEIKDDILSPFEEQIDDLAFALKKLINEKLAANKI